MKCKSSIMFICLIMLTLLSLACVSAAQDIDDNANLTTDEPNVEEATSPGHLDDMELQTSDSELENSDVLKADGDEAVSSQAINDSDNDVLKADGDEAVSSQAINDSDNDILGASAEDDVLGIWYSEQSVRDAEPFYYISYELKWIQGHNYVPKMTFYYTNVNPYSTGEPIYLIGGPERAMTVLGFVDPNVPVTDHFDTIFLGHGWDSHTTFDARGKSSIAYISGRQTLCYFQDIDFVNAVKGAFVIEDMLDEWFVKYNATCRVEFVNCNFKNITGGVVVANYKSNISFRDCVFEDIDSEFGVLKSNCPGVNVTFTDCTFKTVKSKATAEFSNSADGVATFTLKPVYTNYIGAVSCDGNVKLTNCLFWNGTGYVKTNDINIRETTLRNKTVTLRIILENPKTEVKTYNLTFLTDDNGQFKFNYKDDRYFMNELGGDGYNNFSIIFDGDSYILPFYSMGAFETVGGFTYLQNLINESPENSVLELDRNIRYSEVYDKDFVNGIVINKNNLTIDGMGHTIDARGFSRIFNIQSNFRQITLKNMTLINGHHESNYGGAINLYDNYCTLENIEFISNSAKSGGAIYFASNYAKLINCTFDSNRADADGGAIYFANEGGIYATVQNNEFINNTAGNGGAIYTNNARGVNFMGNVFVSNKATLGGAIYNYRSYENIINKSVFFDNAAKMGGAIYYEVNTMQIISSNFSDNAAEKGGAIYVSNKDIRGNPMVKSLDISNSYFMDNKANATEIIVNDDRQSQTLTVALKGGENYINAIYAEDKVTAYFSNSFYRVEDDWESADGMLKSDYAPHVKITVVALSTKNYAYSATDMTDVNGYAYFDYGDAPTGYYPLGNVWHDDDSYYTSANKYISFSVKPFTFTDLQKLINDTPEGGELILTKDFVYSEGDEAITDGILINKSITIIGQGHKIDAKDQTRIFKVLASNVTMTSLEFVNGKNVAGSVAFLDGENIKINNCILSNNPGQVFAKSVGSNFDLNDNWFGSDWTNYNQKPGALGDFEVDRWYFLNVTIVPNKVTLSLNNKYIKSIDSTVVDNDNYDLPWVVFTYASENMRLNATGNVTVWPDNTVSYYAGEHGYYYDGPLSITFRYGDEYFTQSQQFAPELHLEGLPDEVEYWNVSDYLVRVTGTFGEVVRSTLEDRIIFKLGDGRVYAFVESTGDWNNLPIKSVLDITKIGKYNYTLYTLNREGYPAFYKDLKGNFSVVGITTSVNIIPIEDYTVGENKTLTVVLEQTYGNVPEGVLTVSVSGIVIAKIALNGTSRVFTFDLNNLKVGSYVVRTHYDSDSLYYTKSSDTMIFWVNPHESIIDLDIPNSITYGEDLHVKVNITHKVEATYRITDANNVTVEEGNIQSNELLINGLDCGKYTLTVHNRGNATVSESTVTREFIVNKITPKMEVNCSVAGPYVNITVRIDSGATGSILFDNENVAIANGFASYLRQYKSGYHVVNVTYKTDKPEIYNKVSKTVSFYVVYTDPTLKNTTIEVVPEIAGNNVFLTAKVNENATGVVMFTVDGESVVMPIINGEALYYNVLDAGTYSVLITYTGDSKFNANSTLATIVVSDPVKENTTITSKVSINENTAEITVEVNEYATGEVAFTIDGNTCKVDVFFGKAIFKGYFDEGYHEVYIEYLGDDSFEAISTVASFTIEKPALKNTTVDVTARINERDVELFINLDSQTNGFALIDINGSETYIKVDYGFAYYKAFLKPGNYSINVKYLGDNQFYPAETNKAITINQPELKDANLTVYTFIQDNNLLVVIIVPSDATGLVSLDINGTGTYYNLTGNNNEEIPFSTILPIGTYNLTAAYSGDDYYNYSFVSEPVVIAPSLNTDIHAKSAVSETTVTITVEVDSNATGFVEIEIIGKKFYVPVVDGVAKFENRYAKGNYVANVTYLGDDKFMSNNTSVSFIVIEQKESLKNTTLDVDVSVDGNDAVVTVKVSENATGLVAFELGEDVIYLPVNNGQVISEYVLPKGHYDLIVTYMGSDEFNPNQTTMGIDIAEDIMKNTTIDSISIVEFNDVTIIAYVNENATGYVEFEILGEVFYEPVVDGAAVFRNTYPAGPYLVNIKYLGDAKFNPATTVDSFIVIEHKATLKNTTLDVNVTVNGNHVNITAYVNKTVSGLIAFKVDSQEFIYVPINNGVASQQYLLPMGNHTADIIYLGNDEYNAIQVTRTIAVIENGTVLPPLKTVIFAPDVSTTYDGNGYLTITIKDENDKFVASRDVLVTINGKTEVVKTDANGVAKLSTNGLAPNTYIVKIAFEGDGTYANSSTTSKVVVGKAPAAITAKNKAFKKAKKTKKYAITLKSGKNPIKNVKVTLKVKGKSYKAKTNAKGKAVFKIKKLTKKGKFSAKIKFKGNAYYKAVGKKVKITVK